MITVYLAVKPAIALELIAKGHRKYSFVCSNVMAKLTLLGDVILTLISYSIKPQQIHNWKMGADLRCLRQHR